MNVVARHTLESSRLGHEVIPLGDPDVNRVLPIGICRIALREERMAGDRPDVGFVHELVQQTEHHRVPRVRPQERRTGIAMDRAAEQLRRIRIVG